MVRVSCRSTSKNQKRPVWRVSSRCFVVRRRSVYLESPRPLKKWVHDPIILGNDQPFLKGQKETPGMTSGVSDHFQLGFPSYHTGRFNFVPQHVQVEWGPGPNPKCSGSGMYEMPQVRPPNCPSFSLSNKAFTSLVRGSHMILS